MLRPAGDADVEGVVDQRLSLRLSHPVVGRLVQRLAGVRDGEVDDGRYPATRAGAGAGPIVIGGDGAAEGELEVDVHVQHTGQHKVAGRVDNVDARGGLQIHAQGRDLLTRDAHVADEGAGWRHHGTAFDDSVDLHGRASARAYPSIASYPE